MLEKQLVKAADRLAAYIKCLEELNCGNKEFVAAKKSIEEDLRARNMPEVEYFFEQFIPSFALTLDETVLPYGKTMTIDNPAKFPDPAKIAALYEPYVSMDIHVPTEYVGNVLKLCEEKRGIQKNLGFITSNRAVITYEMPFAEIVFDFFDKLKSGTRGYASMDYTPIQKQMTREVAAACEGAIAAGADFVKTSTGYGSAGATVADVQLMRAAVSEKVRVKASGGIRTLDMVLACRNAGAVRCGVSATVKIMEEAKERLEKGILTERPLNPVENISGGSY